MTGQLITSFLQGKVNPTMTSTICNRYVDHATEESKTKFYKELPGATRSSSSYKARVIRAVNDLLPYRLRPIKAKRRRAKAIPNLRHEVYAFRLVWVSHHGPKLIKKLQLLKEIIWK